MMLEDVVTELGYKVAGTAEPVDTALAQIEAQSPDIVLLDLFLHDYPCHYVAERRVVSNIPFVVMSGSTEKRHALPSQTLRKSGARKSS